MSIKYELVIYWSEEDQSFVVEVPELPGCMADGATYEEAVAKAQQMDREGLPGHQHRPQAAVHGGHQSGRPARVARLNPAW